MTRQKNKILTFLFSLIPGAGQMYLGFMKRGLSLILYVVAIACVAIVLSMEELLILVPPVWMYAFFDAINLNGSSEEYFESIQDDYITFDVIPGLDSLTNFSPDTKNIWGKGMVFVGFAFLFYNALNVAGQMAYFANLNSLGWLINDILHYSPRLIISAVLIIMGKSLITGNRKKDEINFRIYVDDHSKDDFTEEMNTMEKTPDYTVEDNTADDGMYEIIIPRETEETEEIND